MSHCVAVNCISKNFLDRAVVLSLINFMFPAFGDQQPGLKARLLMEQALFRRFSGKSQVKFLWVLQYSGDFYLITDILGAAQRRRGHEDFPENGFEKAVYFCLCEFLVFSRVSVVKNQKKPDPWMVTGFFLSHLSNCCSHNLNCYSHNQIGRESGSRG